MEGFLSTFPPYSFCGGHGPSSGPAPGNSWGKREGRLMTPNGLNYLELCKALFSQATPAVPLQPKKANTKDCGVQVNAKVHKLIQCSLGPKTLFSQDGESPGSPKSPMSPGVFTADGTPPVSHMRFLRPVSIYSPVFDRRFYLKNLSLGDESEGEAPENEQREETAEHSGEDTAKELDTSLHLASKGSSLQVSLKYRM